MDLEKELRDLKAQIYDIEEKLKKSNFESIDYESDLIDKVYEICHDDTGELLDKVIEICSLSDDHIATMMPIKDPDNLPSSNIAQDHFFVPKILDYTMLSEAEDTFMEVMNAIIIIYS